MAPDFIQKAEPPLLTYSLMTSREFPGFLLSSPITINAVSYVQSPEKRIDKLRKDMYLKYLDPYKSVKLYHILSKVKFVWINIRHYIAVILLSTLDA